MGQPEAAIAAYKDAIAARPDYAEAYNNLGLTYRGRGRLAEAIDAYRAAVSIKPDFAVAYNNLGVAYGSLGKYAEAMAAWEQAVRVAPNSPAGRAARSNMEMTRARLGG
jgi:superkiller protein 3